jgi:hypothetical protein
LLIARKEAIAEASSFPEIASSFLLAMTNKFQPEIASLFLLAMRSKLQRDNSE